MKKTGLHGYVYDFSVDYDATDVDDIVDNQKYLMKKKWHSVMKCLELLKGFFAGLAFLSSFTSVNSLSCISMNNRQCKVRPQIVLMLLVMSLCFSLLVLKQVNVVVVVIISMIHMWKCMFLML